MFDTHIHTVFSTDSDITIEQAIETAQDEGLKLILTEHMDLGYPVEGEFVFDAKKYFDDYTKYRNKDLLLGIEIGMNDTHIDEYRKICSNDNYDFVIASIHAVDGIDIYPEDYYIGKTKKEAYHRYLKAMEEGIKAYDFADSLGHIDYISRYARYDDTEMYYEEFKDDIDDVLRAVIESEKVIEINTRRMNSKSIIDNLMKIYTRYAELGGKYVTLGSDAHSQAAIGNHFDEAINIVRKIGLIPVYFKERKMHRDRIY